MEPRTCSIKSCKNEPEGSYKMCKIHRDKELEKSRKKRDRAKLQETENCSFCQHCLKSCSRDEMLGVSCVRCRWGRYKKRALGMGLPFDLSLGGFQFISKQPCFWCGSDGKPANGVDRRDNAQGYTIQNAKSCCETCNISKNNLPEGVFIDMCMKVAVKHGSLERLQFLLENKQK